MKAYTRREQSETGQILPLFALVVMVLVMMLVFIVDFGVVVMKEGQSQNVVDAAALAGAQELPDDPMAAEAMARDYATRNGVNGEDLVISFSCTSTNIRICNPAIPTYDTIDIEVKQTSPALFGPVLGLVAGDDSCWSSGCSASADAAACTGVCGAGTSPVDAVVAIDHTASMSDTDLRNAKDGALTLVRMFDYQAQSIGLAVTPAVSPGNKCDSIDQWTDSRTWLPVGLNNVYQTSFGVLNMGSPLVSTINCLDKPTSGELSGPHTDLGQAMKAAADEVLYRGRADVRKGIVFFSDGAANVHGEPAAATAAGSRGPCDYAKRMADQAKAAGIEVYVIAYGADDRCTREQSTSPWVNKSAVELLNSMASDDAHFFNAPRTADLDPIFEAIGQELARGARLVR
jgi:hypothetical protein